MTSSRKPRKSPHSDKDAFDAAIAKLKALPRTGRRPFSSLIMMPAIAVAVLGALLFARKELKKMAECNSPTCEELTDEAIMRELDAPQVSANLPFCDTNSASPLPFIGEKDSLHTE